MARTYNKHNPTTDKMIRTGMSMRGTNSQTATAKKLRQEIFKATGVKYSASSIVNRYYALSKKGAKSKYCSMYDEYAKKMETIEMKQSKTSVDFLVSLVKECREITIENVSDERGILISFK